jgi:hypothetical protein
MGGYGGRQGSDGEGCGWLLGWLLALPLLLVWAIYKKFLTGALPVALGHVFGFTVKYLLRARLFGRAVAALLFAAGAALLLAALAAPYVAHYGMHPRRLLEPAAPAALLASAWLWHRHYYYLLACSENREWVAQESAAVFRYLLMGAFWSAAAAVAAELLRGAVPPAVPPLWPLVMAGFAWRAALGWRRSMAQVDPEGHLRSDPEAARAFIAGMYEEERAKRRDAARRRR